MRSQTSPGELPFVQLFESAHLHQNRAHVQMSAKGRHFNYKKKHFQWDVEDSLFDLEKADDVLIAFFSLYTLCCSPAIVRISRCL